MRISDWSSDVCSSDLLDAEFNAVKLTTDQIRANLALIRGTRLQISTRVIMGEHDRARADFESTGNDDPGKRLAISDRARREALAKIGRASCRERVCQHV